VKEYNPNSFLGSGYKNLDLKYIFDHLRNIGIAAAILIAGVNLDPDMLNKTFPNINLSPGWFSMGLVFLSLVLLSLNFAQLLYISAKKGTRMSASISAFLSLPLYFLTALIYMAYVS
jgi:hypothetical protein